MSPKSQLSGFKLGLWIQLLPLLIMFTLLWVTAWSPFHLGFNTVKFWEYLIYGWVYAVAIYLLGLVVFVRYLRAWWLGAIFAWIYLLFYGINAGFLYHTGAMFNAYFLWFAKPTGGTAYLLDYFTEWIVVITIAFVLSGILATWLIRRNAKTLADASLLWLILLAVVCWGAPVLRDRGIFRPTAAAAVVVHAQLQSAWRLDQTFSLRTLAENPVMIFGRMAFVQRPQPLQPRAAAELTSESGVLKEWHLTLGQRTYPPLHLKPFTRIVMFGTESLSLDLLAPYNSKLPRDLTPFYGSPEMTNRMFINYQCVALPTQPGLSVTFNSHPNTVGLLAGSFEQSLIQYLDRQGYDTYFLSSGPETFLNDRVIFKEMGFHHVIGSQTWLRNPQLAPFVEDRGLMDQMLYNVALNYLETNRNKRIFMQIMNQDTHGPYPRSNYGPLQYPPYPASLEQIADPDVRAVLAGIFRHDYDVGQTIRKMRERGLLTADTLVIFTADHNCPQNEILDKIPGYPQTYYARIPLAFLSGQPLPHADLQPMHSQLDFAPTIVHLLGLPIPAGWWGESIFAPGRHAPAIAQEGRNLIITPPDGGPQQIVSLDHPQTPAEMDLIALFDRIYTNSLPQMAAAETSLRGLK